MNCCSGAKWQRAVLSQGQKAHNDSRTRVVKKEIKQFFQVPRFIFLVIGIVILGLGGLNYLVKNNLYGNKCIVDIENEKKSKFSEQLKLLQNNVQKLDNGSLNKGVSGGGNGYSSIFSDPNLFNNSVEGASKKNN